MLTSAVRTVVGLAAEVNEVDRQSNVLEAMAVQAAQAVEDELYAFARQDERIIFGLQDLADDLMRQREFLKIKIDEAAREEDRVNSLKLAVKKKQEQIETARQEIKTLLGQQAIVEQEIFERLKTIRDTLAKNEELLQKLRDLEGTKY